jgi:hypothetical protein
MPLTKTKFNSGKAASKMKPKGKKKATAKAGAMSYSGKK